MTEEMRMYITPKVETVELKTEGFLAFSSSMDESNPADEPAKARLLEDYIDEDF